MKGVDFYEKGAQYLSCFFDYADDGISISFPDLPGCFSCASSDEEAIKMAKDALGLHLYSIEEDSEEIPDPTPEIYFRHGSRL